MPSLREITARLDDLHRAIFGNDPPPIAPFPGAPTLSEIDLRVDDLGSVVQAYLASQRGTPVGTLAVADWSKFATVADLYPNGKVEHAGLGLVPLKFSMEQPGEFFPSGYTFSDLLGFTDDPHGILGRMLEIKLQAGCNFTSGNPSGVVPYVGIPLGTPDINYPKLWCHAVKRWTPGYTNQGQQGLTVAAQKGFMIEGLNPSEFLFKGIGETLGQALTWEKGYEKYGTKVAGSRTTYAKYGSDPNWDAFFATAHLGAYRSGMSFDCDAWNDGQLYQFVFTWWLEDGDREVTVGMWWRRLTGDSYVNGVLRSAPSNFGNVQNVPSQQDGWNYAWNTYRHNTGKYDRLRRVYLHGNRNRSVDRNVGWAWSNFTVVDGEKNKNPWNLPASVLPPQMR